MPRADLTFRIGTIGFSYKDWQGVFYPPGLPASERLSWYAKQFNALELDTTFHAVPPIERVAGWAEAVPDDFRFVAKVPKAISHEPTLEDKAEALLDFARVLKPMGHKLAYALLQFPPTFGTEMTLELSKLLDKVNGKLPLAIEVRHSSWFRGPALESLRQRGITIVASDYQDRAQTILGPASSIYVRLIGEHERFPVKDHEQLVVNERLDWWLERIDEKAAANATVHILATNDYAGFSPATVRQLRTKVGLPDTTPAPGSTDAPSLFG
jgi:uncharacterized protein YecE (DUF72 family)